MSGNMICSWCGKEIETNSYVKVSESGVTSYFHPECFKKWYNFKKRKTVG